MVRALLCGLLLVLGMARPALAQESEAAKAWQALLDLRDLPAGTRPEMLQAAVDASGAARQGLRPMVSLAINGNVVERRFASAGGPTPIRYRPEDRLLSVHNRVEIAVSLPFCEGAACAGALADASLAAPLSYSVEAPRALPTDFAQAATRMRAGLAIEAGDARGRRLAALVKQALAPRAPEFDGAREDAPARIVVSEAAPEGARPGLRFDLGPVGLARDDGRPILSADELARMNVVQLLWDGGRPLIWVRPGAALPPAMELGAGDVAVFDGARRLIAYSTDRDAVVEPAYPAGSDPFGAERAVRIRRWVLLGLWVLVTIGCAVVFVRVARRRREAIG